MLRPTAARLLSRRPHRLKPRRPKTDHFLTVVLASSCVDFSSAVKTVITDSSFFGNRFLDNHEIPLLSPKTKPRCFAQPAQACPAETTVLRSAQSSNPHHSLDLSQCTQTEVHFEPNALGCTGQRIQLVSV